MKNRIVASALFFKKTPTRRLCVSAMRAAFFAAIFSVFLIVSVPVRSQENQTSVDTDWGPVVAQISTEPANPTNLSPIVLSVALEKPKQLQLATDDVDGIYGDFEVAVCDEKEETPREIDGKRDVVVRRWTLYPKRRGTLILPPIPLTLSQNFNAGDESNSKTVSLIIPERRFEIPMNDAPSVPLESLAPNWSPIRRFPLLFVAIAAFATITTLGAIVAIRKRSRRALVPFASNVPQETPSESALRRLDELKASRLYLENDADFYPAVSAILRRYLAEEFGLFAEEKTTQEVSAFLANESEKTILQIVSNKEVNDNKSKEEDLERSKIIRDILKTPEIRRDVEHSLSAVDLVKFARRSPTFDDARQIFEATRRAVSTASEKLADALRKLEERQALEERRDAQISNQPAPKI